MPFNMRTRSASRARSVDSSSSYQDDPREHDMDPEPEQNINIHLTDMEYKKLNTDEATQERLTKTLQDPVGNLIVRLVDRHNKTLPPEEDPIELDTVCMAFDNKLQLNKKDITELIENSAKDLKSDIFHKELNFHLLNPRYIPPTKFSPTDVLNSNAKSSEALKLFPSNMKSKFSGIRGDGPNLSEFLFNISYAQERLNLSEKEFKMKLLTSLTGPAHEDIRNLVEQGDTVTSIYHNLASMYDSTPEPNKAKQDLMKFKIPRRWDLYKTQNHILSLSNSAARLYKDAKIRKIIANTEASQSFIRSLPPASSKFARTKYNEFLTSQAHINADPLFVDFIRFLNKYQDDINEDIRQNGSSYDDRDNRDNRNNNIHRDSRYTNNPQPYKPYRPLQRIQTTYAYPQSTSRSNNAKPYQRVSVKAVNTSSPIQNKYLNKLYCSLCGKSNHTSSQGCYAIKRNGVVVPCSPTQIPCTICEKVNGKKLYHPPTLCFNKEQSNNFKPRSTFNNQRNYKKY